MDNNRIKQIKKESRIINEGIRLSTKVKPSKKIYNRKKDKRKTENDLTIPSSVTLYTHETTSNFPNSIPA